MLHWVSRHAGRLQILLLPCLSGILYPILDATAIAAPVWVAEFEEDGDFDGMTEFHNGNPAKAMFDPAGASNGTLQAQLQDGVAYEGQHDKGGRLLGANVAAATSSFSGYYKFSWSQLAETSAEVAIAAGFLGESQVHSSREFLGSVMRHRKNAGNYEVNVGTFFGGVGINYSGYKGGVFVSLGPNALNTTYQLVVSWNPEAHVLRAVLYSSSGVVLADNLGDLDSAADYPNLHLLGQSAFEADLNATEVKYLGWQDYLWNLNQQTIAWNVDRVSYFGDAEGAFSAVESLAPTGACCLAPGNCLDDQTAAECAGAEGTFQGPGTACGSTLCPEPQTGACCMDDGTCAAATAAGCTGTWYGEGLTCGQAGCVAGGFDQESWEVYYTGFDSAADNVANWLRWDSAIDDDWWQPGVTFRLNHAASGFMSVDRVSDPDDHIKTGNIWIRDPILSHAAGLTMEVRVLIKPNSNANAFSMTCLDDGSSLGVHLSPNQIKVGDLAAAGAGTTVAFNTTDRFHLYRVVKLPGSHLVRVYVDDAANPAVTGSGNTNYIVGGSAYYLYPRVLIGDNENNTSYNANYTLDFARYRRGAAAPGQTPPLFPERALPPLPPPASPGEAWTTGYDGTGLPSSQGWIQAGGSTYTQHPGGIMEINALTGLTNNRMDAAPGWTNRAGLTLEARIKVMPDSQEHGFNLMANDILGDIALALSPGKVVLLRAHMPVGLTEHLMDTTSEFHVYRLTRDPDGLYWHLYIDDNPVPAISHQHAGGNQLSFSRIWWGDIAFPVPGNGFHVLVDYIRWHEGASAPDRRCPVPFADSDGDRDVDADDFGEFQTCFSGDTVGILPGCVCFDRDVSGSIDRADFNAFSACANGPGVPADDGCE